ncbi:DUF4148 domain-containing protein [Paraburkholderia lacunae]|uniref:DUF4148 domain-containing protein n=1 Tax=Paraburkholderia lacunae TaxID=2211104 RepID=A0A370NCD7_9BURK|nr:DUF4148 domain-containing protein [Paraburkholderia lacunae]RDK03253.1 DUF4148 domain-containing protein [Paraburkholderia lacunae]
MKLLTAVAVAALGLSFGATAFAQTASSGSTSSALTRAEVVAQLAQAQAEGYLPMSDGDYPPSAATIAHNREIYAIQHGTDGMVRTAGSPAAHPEPVSN